MIVIKIMKDKQENEISTEFEEIIPNENNKPIAYKK